jgi:hypothetical protein
MLLLSHVSLVECQLLALQDVAVNPTALARPRAHDCIESTCLKLSLQRRFDLSAGLQPLLSLGLDALADFGGGDIRGGGTALSSSANVGAVVCFVPGSEGSSIDLHNGGFGEGVGADEFVVGRVVGHDNDTDFAGDTFATPGEVAGFEAQGTIFGVTTASADEMD